MHILIAEDDFTSRFMLKNILQKQGYDVIDVCNGLDAWEIMQKPDHPQLAILDWIMPQMDGIEVCRKIRSLETNDPPYIIILTTRDSKEDIVAGLAVGANDYIGKPYHREELQARVSVGIYTLGLQAKLTAKIRELEEASAHIKTLQGIIPICSFCKKIRNDQNYWQQVDEYISSHSKAEFSHGICPDCLKEKYPDIAFKILQKLEHK